MNTYTNAMHPKKEVHRTARNKWFPNMAIVTIILTLVAMAVIVAYISSRPVAAENNSSVTYGNALEMQYARPWLDAQNKPIVAYGNALEIQYAQTWLDAQNKPVISYGNALEWQYAQPWQLPIVVTGDAQEQILLNCHSSLEMLYACKYGYARP